MNTFDWKELERDARAVAMDRLTIDETTPLELGAHIAWTDTGWMGATSGLSSAHRVGEPIGSKPHTTCGAAIPEPIRRLILTPAIIDALAPCGFCEAGVSRITPEYAA